MIQIASNPNQRSSLEDNFQTSSLYNLCQDDLSQDSLSQVFPDAVPKVCVVDDDESSRMILEAIYTNAGYDVSLFACPLQALKAQNGESSMPPGKFDLFVCDLKMPEMNGLDFIKNIRELKLQQPIILLTGHSSNESAIESIGRGAFNYLTKPINPSEISIVSECAIKGYRLEQLYLALKRERSTTGLQRELVGRSAQMQLIFDKIHKVSQSLCNVLITGESGTGKEIVARAIHSESSRASKPFVAINCSAIPDHLLESELFGHTRGSFTGATERRRGLLEEAQLGTVFLDEIGDMPLPLQAKLLRFLQDKSIKAIGENTYRKIDVRVIAATHQNLEKAVSEGRFREDLYYRICVAPITVPPLRDRGQDILLLADHFLEKMSQKQNTHFLGFSKGAIAKLCSHRWPGNVRELENTIERAVVFCEGRSIDEASLEMSRPFLNGANHPETHANVNSSINGNAGDASVFSRLMSLDKLEQEYIQFVLTKLGNKREKAAEILGLNRKTLYRKQKQYQLS